MELEKQVCSLELAKKLRDLGVPQESVFYWAEPFPLVSDKLRLITAEAKSKWETGNGGGAIHFEKEAVDVLMRHVHAAFTVAELGEMLPKYLPPKSNSEDNDVLIITRVGIRLKGAGLDCQYRYQVHEPSHRDVKLADALAKMLIYLIEQGILKPTTKEAGHG